MFVKFSAAADQSILVREKEEGKLGLFLLCIAVGVLEMNPNITDRLDELLQAARSPSIRTNF